MERLSRRETPRPGHGPRRTQYAEGYCPATVFVMILRVYRRQRCAAYHRTEVWNSRCTVAFVLNYKAADLVIRGTDVGTALDQRHAGVNVAPQRCVVQQRHPTLRICFRVQAS